MNALLDWAFDLDLKTGRHMSLIWILKREDIPSIWAIHSAGSLFKDKKEDFVLCLLVLALLVYPFLC